MITVRIKRENCYFLKFLREENNIIFCIAGKVLDTFTKEEVNPFDRSTQFTSYSYTANYNNFGNDRDYSFNKRNKLNFPNSNAEWLRPDAY